MKKFTILITIGIILLVLLIWGLIGSSQTVGVGTNCDLGIGNDGSVFCWIWHQNSIGDVKDTINEIFDN